MISFSARRSGSMMSVIHWDICVPSHSLSLWRSLDFLMISLEKSFTYLYGHMARVTLRSVMGRRQVAPRDLCHLKEAPDQNPLSKWYQKKKKSWGLRSLSFSQTHGGHNSDPHTPRSVQVESNCSFPCLLSLYLLISQFPNTHRPQFSSAGIFRGVQPPSQSSRARLVFSSPLRMPQSPEWHLWKFVKWTGRVRLSLLLPSSGPQQEQPLPWTSLREIRLLPLSLVIPGGWVPSVERLVWNVFSDVLWHANTHIPA